MNRNAKAFRVSVLLATGTLLLFFAFYEEVAPSLIGTPIVTVVSVLTIIMCIASARIWLAAQRERYGIASLEAQRTLPIIRRLFVIGAGFVAVAIGALVLGILFAANNMELSPTYMLVSFLALGTVGGTLILYSNMIKHGFIRWPY